MLGIVKQAALNEITQHCWTGKAIKSKSFL